MPNLLAFEPAQFLGFLVILGRISGLFVSAPLLSDATIPPMVKSAFAFILSLVFYPVVAAPRVALDPNGAAIILLLAKEFGVGLIIGFTGRLLLAGVSMAGEVIGFQMGLGIANVFDPSSNTQVALIGQIKLTFALLLYVLADGHHLLIRTLAVSYRFIGPGSMAVEQPLITHFMGMAGRIFVIGLQIGAPLIVAMMAANFSIGLMARSVPQVNVFVVGFPFTIGLGLVLLALGFPFFVEAVVALLTQLEALLLAGLKGG